MSEKHEESADKLAELGYIQEAVEMLGKGYDGAIEIHKGETFLKSTDDGLQEVQTAAWIKLTTSFRNVMATLKGSRLSVFLCICLHINNENNCYPSVETIADETGYSRREVINAVQELEKIGFLTVKRGEMKSNLYHVNVAVAIGAENAPVHFATKQVHSEAKNMSQNALKEESIKKEIKKDASGYQKFSQKVTDERKEMLKLGERIEATLGITPDWNNKKWEKAVRGILKKEESGQSFDRFVKWLRSGNEYNRPKPFQIAKDPTLILNNWAQAFMNTVENAANTVTRNSDGSLYV